MLEAEIYRKLTSLFRDVFAEDDLEITSETSAADIYGWDSFNQIRLVAAVEKAFRIKFQTAEIKRTQNVGQFVRLINAKLLQ